MDANTVERVEQRQPAGEKLRRFGRSQLERFRQGGEGNHSQQGTALRLLVGFFAFMLVFTLLSRAADGLTVARVDTAAVASGELNYSLTASGEVRSALQQTLSIPGGLEIERMYGKAGDSIKSGEVLAAFRKEAADLLLKQKKNELNSLVLQRDMERADEVQLITAQRGLENAKQDAAMARTESQEAVTRAEKEMREADEAYRKLYIEHQYLVGEEYANWMEAPAWDAEEIEELSPSSADSEEKAAWKNSIRGAKSELDAARKNAESREQALQSAIRANEQAKRNGERSIATAQLTYDEAMKTASEAERSAALKRESLSLEIRKKQEELTAVERIVKDCYLLKSDTDGSILSVKGESGATSTAGDSIVVLPNGADCEVKATITKAQSKWVSTGDSAGVTLTADGRRTVVDGKVTSIGLGKEEGEYEITVTLPRGAYLSGEIADVDCSKRSAVQQMLLPLSALHSDSAGQDYVLVAFARDTVLGQEMTAKRVDIKVIDRDSKNMSVEGPLSAEDQVITGSTRELKSGDRIRLGGTE